MMMLKAGSFGPKGRAKRTKRQRIQTQSICLVGLLQDLNNRNDQVEPGLKFSLCYQGLLPATALFCKNKGTFDC